MTTTEPAEKPTATTKRKLSSAEADAGVAKKTKPVVESGKTETEAFPLDDGDDLIPLTSQGPNVVYGWAHAISDIFHDHEEDECECEGIYWSKAMIYDEFEKGSEKEGYNGVLYMSIHGIKADECEELFPEWEDSKSADAWWYELTVTREEPQDTEKKCKVKLHSSLFERDGCMFEGKDLGEWWLVDLKPAEGDSLNAIKTVHRYFF